MNNETLKKFVIVMVILSVLEFIMIFEITRKNIEIYKQLDFRIHNLEVSIMPGFYK